MHTIIFTDGAARGNPGPGGWGVIIAGEDMVTELGGGEVHTTNNRMELTAAIVALQTVGRTGSVTVYTDSAYVLSGITRWVIGWQRNNWKTSQKEDVLNRDLWEQLVVLSAKRSIHWKFLKGHSGIPANERCDAIATAFADSRPIVLYSGSRARYGVSLDVPDQLSIKTKKKGKTRAYSYVSEVDGIVKTHKTWEDCRDRVSGVPDARFKKSVSAQDEKEIMIEFERT